MYRIVLSTRAKKALRKYRTSGTFPLKKFDRAIECLRRGAPLPAAFKDHSLLGDLAAFRELHVAADLLVQYERDEVLHLITLVKIGTHSALFGD